MGEKEAGFGKLSVRVVNHPGACCHLLGEMYRSVAANGEDLFSGVTKCILHHVSRGQVCTTCGPPESEGCSGPQGFAHLLKDYWVAV